jgi:hypothetical protein
MSFDVVSFDVVSFDSDLGFLSLSGQSGRVVGGARVSALNYCRVAKLPNCQMSIYPTVFRSLNIYYVTAIIFSLSQTI